VQQIEEGVVALRTKFEFWKPKWIIACGNEALRTVLGFHPNDYHALPGIEEARGYPWDRSEDSLVIGVTHPASVLREWVPWMPLLRWDLQKMARLVKGKQSKRETKRLVHVSLSDERWVVPTDGGPMALDIENTKDLKLSCMAAATSAEFAVVYPAAACMHYIEQLCYSKRGKIFQNGMYDRYFLKRFCDLEVQNVVFDTMLAWHAVQPELAGMKEEVSKRKKMRRKTQKGLRFLASIFTMDRWWKDYAFESGSTEQFELCGRDACVTYEIADKLGRMLT